MTCDGRGAVWHSASHARWQAKYGEYGTNTERHGCAVLLSGLGRCMYASPIIDGTGLLLLLESAGSILQHVLGVVRARRE